MSSTPIDDPTPPAATPAEPVTESGSEQQQTTTQPTTAATADTDAGAQSTLGSIANSPITPADTQRFVYPVRSLLSKSIRPASEMEQEQNAPVSRPRLVRGGPSSEHVGNRAPSPAPSSPKYGRRGSFHQENFGQLPSLIRSTSLRTLPSTQTQRQTKMRSPVTDENDVSAAPAVAPSVASKPMSDGVTETEPASVVPSTFVAGASAAAVLSRIADGINPITMLTGQARPRALSDGASESSARISEYHSPPPGGEPVLAATGTTEPGEPLPDGEVSSPAPSPLDFSRAGFVHLGPAGDTHRGRTPSVGRSTSTNSQHDTNHATVRSASKSGGEEDGSSGVPGSSASEASGDVPSSESLEELVVTERLKFITDENGNHIIVGREGRLARCEDEPIRTPGAVQGYGVLIAVDEDIETGSLIVRQVSENSTQILGLTPQYLFSLECFTDCLPENTADAFWDNIQFLNAPATTEDPGAGDSGEDTIHVFMINGMGEPGSAGPNDLEVGPDNRRLWHCWCAAHRPQSVVTSTGNGPSVSSDVSGMIILEFELERDMHNPLYPPPSTSDFPSGTGSPDSRSASVGAGSDSAHGSSIATQSDSVGTGSTSMRGSAGMRSGSGTGSIPSLHTNLSGNTLVSGEGGAGSSVGSEAAPNSLTGNTAATGSTNQSMSGVASSGDPGTTAYGLAGDEEWTPTPEHIFESTTNRARPLPALQRLRQMSRLATNSSGGSGTPSSQLSGSATSSARRRGNPRRMGGANGGVGMMDVFAVMSQINEQLGATQSLELFLKIVVGIIKDLTQFHRVLVYQFDEAWNGQVVAELVDWHRTHDLYMGLHFPATDIPAQARELYTINKVRMLYDRELPTARLVVRSKKDLESPLNMTHCYLRAMSPIHQKYLANMGVRASMSISIMAFGTLWGLIACHSYGSKGMRVSFPVRQMLRVLSQSISRNIERLSYAQRLHTRKLINTITSDAHPGGYIVSNADDLLGLFDADYGMLVIGEGAKILGPNTHGQEILTVAEYLRLKQFSQMQVSQAVNIDFPDLKLSTGLEVIAGLLYVPLSSGGKDFIAFLRKGQPREVHWAGKPYKADSGQNAILEPRVSFKAWSQTVAGRSRAWTDEQLETAGVLSLVYGKFIEVWRQKETALQSKKLTTLLLSNASHEVRTPLNHIINYLELALNGSLDGETRENLQRSHSASKSLLFTINDLLDLTRLESGGEISFNEPFDLRKSVSDAAQLYRNEASRRNLEFVLDVSTCPQCVIGDSKKIQTVVANLTGNALKYTERGTISVVCRAFDEPHGLRDSGGVAVEIIVSDTGCGISSTKLESIFREFEQVESSQEASRDGNNGVGLGLAVVAHIVEQLGGQLRVDSKVGEGSRFSFLIPFALPDEGGLSRSPNSSLLSGSRPASTNSSAHSARSQIDNFVEAIGGSHMRPSSIGSQERPAITGPPHRPPYADGRQPSGGYFEVVDSPIPVRGLKVDESELDQATARVRTPGVSGRSQQRQPEPPSMPHSSQVPSPVPRDFEVHRHPPTPSRPKIKRDSSSQSLRILIVEDDDVNRMLLAKRLSLKGHAVVTTINGQECVDKIKEDREFDCILMDIQMPILDGFQATVRVREIEREDCDGAKSTVTTDRESHRLNGRIPIFVVSASLREEQRPQLNEYGLDGWVLKPINFKRLVTLLDGITNTSERTKNLYQPNNDWELGGWLTRSTQAGNTAGDRGSTSSPSGAGSSNASTA